MPRHNALTKINPILRFNLIICNNVFIHHVESIISHDLKHPSYFVWTGTIIRMKTINLCISTGVSSHNNVIAISAADLYYYIICNCNLSANSAPCFLHVTKHLYPKIRQNSKFWFNSLNHTIDRKHKSISDVLLTTVHISYYFELVNRNFYDKV